MLPLEIVAQVISYISILHGKPANDLTQRKIRFQVDLNNCCLISRVWYAAAIEALYEDPLLSGRCFERFVAAICPSINPHVRTNGLARLVKRLDLSHLVHHGSKSMTARLLGRVKDQLEFFKAPQATFG